MKMQILFIALILFLLNLFSKSNLMAQQTISGQKDPVFQLDQQPEFPGGEKALSEFLKSHLDYPVNARENGIEGAVWVAFIVLPNGKISHFKIIKELGFGCDEEVLRLIDLLKYEKAYNKGRNVAIHRKLKVDFKLPSPKIATKQTINYQVLPKVLLVLPLAVLVKV